LDVAEPTACQLVVVMVLLIQMKNAMMEHPTPTDQTLAVLIAQNQHAEMELLTTFMVKFVTKVPVTLSLPSMVALQDVHSIFAVNPFTLIPFSIQLISFQPSLEHTTTVAL